jgi:hypothetical protein
MADLHEACANVGLDSSKLRPIAHATVNGRVAVYIGAAWQELPRGKALNLRDQLTRALDDLQQQSVVSDSGAPERFEVQLTQWRDGIRACPPLPALGAARAAELERRAMEAMQSETQS